MLMFARSRAFRRLIGVFLVSVAAVFAILFGASLLLQATPVPSPEAIVAACVLLGLLWVILGWILAPSVETYLGQGAFEGVPIIGTRFANPERNDAVVRDLAPKLAGQTDAGIILAALGFLLMTVGVVYYAFPGIGLVAILVYLAGVAGLCALAYLPRRASRPA